MAIIRVPTPALACVVVVTGKGDNGKDVIVLFIVAVVIGKAV